MNTVSTTGNRLPLSASYLLRSLSVPPFQKRPLNKVLIEQTLDLLGIMYMLNSPRPLSRLQSLLLLSLLPSFLVVRVQQYFVLRDDDDVWGICFPV